MSWKKTHRLLVIYSVEILGAVTKVRVNRVKIVVEQGVFDGAIAVGGMDHDSLLSGHYIRKSWIGGPIPKPGGAAVT